MTLESLGRVLATSRENMKLTVKDLAFRVNSSPEYIRDLESGEALPDLRLSFLAELIEILGIKVEIEPGKDETKKAALDGDESAVVRGLLLNLTDMRAAMREKDWKQMNVSLQELEFYAKAAARNINNP
ncbi:helix-turn-helix domain-containing protein [Pyramidobacter piscolens]|uniref:helix-turn-helix domain-containing protein n=1 Tax=Pyramidobacter piscolens TaxID=638849 RepID=UPI0026665348|nr:helix-turn-helix transcriptional regulator [Pyramidobacter piscolens]